MDNFNGVDLKLYFKEIITNYNNIHCKNLIVQDFLLKSINHEVKGFLADYYNLTLKCIKHDAKEMTKEQEEDANDEQDQEKVEIPLFVKKLPQMLNKTDERLIIFHKESNLYRHLLPKLRNFSSNIWLPHVYLCRDDILILEDLRYSNDQYIHCLNQQKATIKEMFAILKTLASMHCSSLIYEERYRLHLDELFSNYLHEISISLNIKWFNVGLKTILEIVEYFHPLYKNNNKALKDLEVYLKSICVMAQTSKTYRNVLCHRDIWGGNILLNNNATKVCFVDFQCCRYCPPAIDVIFTLYMNLSKDVLHLHQEEFLTFYYAELLNCWQHYHITTEKSNDSYTLPITRNEFWQSYNELKLIGLVYRAIAATILNVPKIMVDDDYKTIERFTKLQKYMLDNKEFRQLMLEYIQDIIDYIIS